MTREHARSATVTVRPHVWYRLDGDRVVYDNQFGAADDAEPTAVLGGGGIQIQK